MGRTNSTADCLLGVQRGREEAEAAAGDGCAAGSEEALGASLKDPGDTRTYLTTADVRAQAVIVDGLRRAFPGVVLVGEEDEGEEGAAALAERAAWWPAGGQELQGGCGVCGVSVVSEELPDEYRALRLSELVVFIDPLDGTREFVHGRLDAVQTLIGVAWRGRPVAGAIGLPFHDGRAGRAPEAAGSEAAGAVLHGIVGLGLFGLPGGTADADGAAQPGRVCLVCAASKTVKEDVLVKTHAIVGGQTLVAGGCGNKILQLLTGAADVAVFNLGTSLWDTCATEALLAAAGGRLTTLLGHPIDHTAAAPTPNRWNSHFQ